MALIRVGNLCICTAQKRVNETFIIYSGVIFELWFPAGFAFGWNLGFNYNRQNPAV